VFILFSWESDGGNVLSMQGRPQADATDAAALGPSPLGAPRRGGWVDCLFLPDTPCARQL